MRPLRVTTCCTRGLTHRFFYCSTTLKNALWWKNVRLWLIIIGLVALVIFFIVWVRFGPLCDSERLLSAI